MILLRYFSYFLLLLFFSSCTKEERIADRKCNTPVKQLFCVEECKKNGDYTEFEINIEKKLVLMKSYDDNADDASATFIYSNCIIFDKNNWDCTNSPNKIESLTMQNGVYRLSSKLGDYYICGKKNN
jgi:hypothetical protein